MQRSLKNYSPDIYGKALGRLDFPNSYNFEKTKDAFFSFIQNVIGVIDLVVENEVSQDDENETHRNVSTGNFRKNKCPLSTI